MIAALIICAAAVVAVLVLAIRRGTISGTRSDNQAGNADITSAVQSAELAASEAATDSSSEAATEAVAETAYVKSLSEVSGQTINRLQSKAKDVYQSEVVSGWSDGETLNSLDYLGDILQIASNPDTAGYHNRLYLVYRAAIQDTFENDGGDSYDKENIVYWYIMWPDIETDGSESQTPDLNSYSIPTHRVQISSGLTDGEWGVKSWYYAGYSSLDSLYQDTVELGSGSTYEDDVKDTVSTGSSDDADSSSSDTESDSSDNSADKAGSSSEENSGSSNSEDPGGQAADTQNEDNGSSQSTDTQAADNTGSQGTESQAASQSLAGEVLPDSDTRWLSESDIDGLSVDQLQSAINLIYARHGYRFNKENVRSHYEAYDWYNPTVAPEDFDDDALLSETERHNLYLLQRRRNALKNSD